MGALVKSIKARVMQWLPALDRRVWILAGGRLLSQIGIGFTLFYAPIFFVNQVGLSATQVGLGIGAGALFGMVARFLGGTMADSPRWGRRATLLLSTLISALADGVLVLSINFSLFVVGNLLMGFGVGLYWPATDAVIADITTTHQRNEAFALVRLADSIGLGLGVVFGGLLISLTEAYRALFVIDGITFLLFFAIIYVAIPETLQSGEQRKSFWAGWGHALRDANLMIYALVNVMFTSFLAQVQSALPVYLNRYGETASGQRFFGRGVEPAVYLAHCSGRHFSTASGTESQSLSLCPGVNDFGLALGSWILPGMAYGHRLTGLCLGRPGAGGNGFGHDCIYPDFFLAGSSPGPRRQTRNLLISQFPVLGRRIFHWSTFRRLGH
jgi:MFS family permease